MGKRKRRAESHGRSLLARVPGAEGRELRQRFADLETLLGDVNTSLAATPEGSVRQEALRRARLRILVEMDNALDSPAVAGGRPHLSATGPKRGVYSVQQGGSPGLGKRR